MTIRIDVETASITDAINGLLSPTGKAGMARLYREVGELLVDSTRERFNTSQAPDGSSWPLNSPTTFDKFLAKKSRIKGKDGRLNERGKNYVLSKRPLIDEGYHLPLSISMAIEDNALIVGSSAPDAAMQHFGGTKADFPHLWGDIPARPFLGISDADEEGILGAINRILRESVY